MSKFEISVEVLKGKGQLTMKNGENFKYLSEDDGEIHFTGHERTMFADEIDRMQRADFIKVRKYEAKSEAQAKKDEKKLKARKDEIKKQMESLKKEFKARKTTAERKAEIELETKKLQVEYNNL